MTQRGANTANAIGLQLRKWALSASNWIDVDNYDPREVYVLASSLHRSRDSATAQLFGLFGMDLSFPLPEVSGTDFKIALPTLENDFIISANEDSCPRLEQVKDDL